MQPDTLAAAATGTRIVALTRLRDMLAADLDTCESMRDKAALSLRFMDVLAQIDELGGYGKPKAEETALDEFTTRLHERQSTAKAPRRAKRG